MTVTGFNLNLVTNHFGWLDLALCVVCVDIKKKNGPKIIKLSQLLSLKIFALKGALQYIVHTEQLVGIFNNLWMVLKLLIFILRITHFSLS